MDQRWRGNVKAGIYRPSAEELASDAPDPSEWQSDRFWALLFNQLYASTHKVIWVGLHCVQTRRRGGLRLDFLSLGLRLGL